METGTLDPWLERAIIQQHTVPDHASVPRIRAFKTICAQALHLPRLLALETMHPKIIHDDRCIWSNCLNKLFIHFMHDMTSLYICLCCIILRISRLLLCHPRPYTISLHLFIVIPRYLGPICGMFCTLQCIVARLITICTTDCTHTMLLLCRVFFLGIARRRLPCFSTFPLAGFRRIDHTLIFIVHGPSMLFVTIAWTDAPSMILTFITFAM